MSLPNDEAQTTERTLGVLGGMGPLATADFLSKLVEVTPVRCEQDHLHVLIDSNPKVPDRNRAVAGQGTSPAVALATMARRLEQAGADLLVMACNTAHAFDPAIRQAVRIPFISLVEEGCDACVRNAPGARTVGLLAAPGCIDAGLYQTGLARRGLQPLLPDTTGQTAFNELLYQIKLGAPRADLAPRMQQLARQLIDRGADVLLAACTEVPLVLQPSDVDRPLIDATRNLAERCVLYARGQAPLPPSSLPSPKD